MGPNFGKAPCWPRALLSIKTCSDFILFYFLVLPVILSGYLIGIMGGKQKKRVVGAFQNKKCPSVGPFPPPPPQTREKKCTP